MIRICALNLNAELSSTALYLQLRTSYDLVSSINNGQRVSGGFPTPLPSVMRPHDSSHSERSRSILAGRKFLVGGP